MAESASTEDHRSFLNQYYGWARHVYDVTRKYYLFGRDTAIRQLLDDPSWKRLVEIGPGTGRNLRKLHEGRPSAMLGGIEASDEMLEHARGRCPWARLQHGFAETADYADLLGERPDVVLFSYCLSMVQDEPAALENARRTLAPGGRVVVVDFADLSGMRTPLRQGLRKWLDTFHVEPLDETILEPFAPTLTYGPGRYFLIAEIAAATDRADDAAEMADAPGR
jgi:S-adenosylmethionine-diacylgycerolhomoserine-N-methlytransferase